MSKVLVTGGSGFLGSHVILRLLADGHEVRTTVRDLKRESEVRALLKEGGAEPGARLTFAAADLEKDDGWDTAVAGCEFVHHVASPFPAGAPKNEDELIVPAREGALRLLRAAKKTGVKRVVLTSSFAAVGYGLGERPAPYDERDWSNPDGGAITAYAKSKTLAERAAWEFVASDAGPELSVVNPVAIFGPVLGRDYSTSILLIRRLMEGAMPGLPRIRFGVVDVRDVADLHVRAMTNPAAKGERFLAVSGDFMTIREIAEVLRTRMGAAASRVPARELPNWVVRLASLRDPAVRQIVPELGRRKNATSQKAQRLLGWKPRSREEAIVSTAENLLRLGLVKGLEAKAA